MGWRGLLTLLLGFNEVSSSKEGNFTTAVGSAAGHLPFPPVVDRGYAKYHLLSTIEFPLPTEPECSVSTCFPTPLHPP